MLEVENFNIKAPKSGGSVDIRLLQTEDSYYRLSNSKISATDHSGMPLTPHHLMIPNFLIDQNHQNQFTARV